MQGGKGAQGDAEDMAFQQDGPLPTAGASGGVRSRAFDTSSAAPTTDSHMDDVVQLRSSVIGGTLDGRRSSRRWLKHKDIAPAARSAARPAADESKSSQMFNVLRAASPAQGEVTGLA